MSYEYTTVFMRRTHTFTIAFSVGLYGWYGCAMKGIGCSCPEGSCCSLARVGSIL